MQHVKQYVKQNNKQLQQIFNSMGTQNTIQATKVYSFIQSAFDTQQFKFIKNNTSIFTNQQNQQHMQTLLESYYLSKNQAQTKFYMYRVTFQFNQIIEFIKFWLNKDKQIQVIYKGQASSQKYNHLGYQQQQINNMTTQKINFNQIENTNNNLHNLNNLNNINNPSNINNLNNLNNTNNKKQQDQQQQKDDNQFMPDPKDIPVFIKSYTQEIHKYQQNIKTKPLDQKQILKYNQKIQQLQTKITFLQDILKPKLGKSPPKLKTTQDRNIRKSSDNIQQSLSTSPKKSLSPTKIDTILKSIFQFYAKQLHFTGVKNSFERIQHESSRINYQKLVHFLKQYKIFPNEIKDQKKIHHFYVKSSSNTRDLTYDGFINLLEKLSQIIIPSQNQNKNKFQLLKLKIIEQRRKNKVLNNPFHSLEKQDFRIDKATLKYQFKLMPLNGKDSDQIVNELQTRKQIKQQKKQQKQHQQMGKKIRYIKKLQAIDPFHPLVQKNKHLIKQRSVLQSQPIVSMDNIEMYRDKNFDLKMFGIEIDQGLSKNQSPVKGNLGNNNSYLIKNRVKQVQKLQVDKMKNLMSGIIQRSNAKLQKMGISPNKKSSIY